jgi:hypothetical protein
MEPQFNRHVMKRETGHTWRCARPGTNIYGFRVTWAPGVLVMTGDLGDLVISHQSFTEPWSAAAWVRGSSGSVDYFLSKSNVDTKFQPEETARRIVSHAYEILRQTGSIRAFKPIVDEFGGYGADPEVPADRKEACRDLLNCGEIDERRAYDIAEDSELLSYGYADFIVKTQVPALRWWADELWRTEPAWHVALRKWRGLKHDIRRFRQMRIVWSPIRYAQYRDGRPVLFNGVTFWRWAKRQDGRRVYEALAPLNVFGIDATRFGFWCLQGSSWPDDGPTDRWGRPTTSSQFVDVRHA